MTLRKMLGDDERLVHQQVDDLLNREDGLIVLFDGDRMVSYSAGFGVSPCQLELLTVEIERSLRSVIGGESTTTRKRRENREKVEKATVVALALLFVSIWVVLAAGITAVWLTEEVRVFGLVILPTGIVAGLLVVYFAWRDNLRRRALAERGGHRTAA